MSSKSQTLLLQVAGAAVVVVGLVAALFLFSGKDETAAAEPASPPATPAAGGLLGEPPAIDTRAKLLDVFRDTISSARALFVRAAAADFLPDVFFVMNSPTNPFCSRRRRR